MSVNRNPCLTERLLMGHKNSNQTNKHLLTNLYIKRGTNPGFLLESALFAKTQLIFSKILEIITPQYILWAIMTSLFQTL